jgi:hypothetical protein
MPVKASPHRYQFATHPESAHRHADYSLIGGIVHFFLKRLLTGFIKTTTSGHHLLTHLLFYYHFVESSLIFRAKDWKSFTWPAWIVVEAETTRLRETLTLNVRGRSFSLTGIEPL